MTVIVLLKIMYTMFETMCSYKSLLAAYSRARCAGRYKEEVLRFGYALEANVISLHNDLMNSSYTHGSYREFIVNDSKKRHIKAATFRDRVVHNALYYTIEPLFDRTFIADSYACRKGKGTHNAVARVTRWTHKKQYAYVLSCDISSYFASINHDILLSLLKKKIQDKKILHLCELIIQSSGSNGKGIPIGNLTSQLFANMYLDVLDRYIKQMFPSVGYIRYMDDFLIFHNDIQILHAIKKDIEIFLQNKLLLTLHPRKAVVSSVGGG